MTHPSRDRLKAVRIGVREILMRDWDPIGIQDVPQARDEYDTYADQVMSMLLNDDVSAEDLTSYLLSVEKEPMGLKRADPQKRQAVYQRIAEALIILRGELQV